VTGEALLQALEADDAARVLSVASTTSEIERAAAWDVAVERLAPRRWHTEMAGLDEEATGRRQRAQALFSLVSGPPDLVRVIGTFAVLLPDLDDVEAALKTRSADWKRAFAAAVLRSCAAEKEVESLGPWWWENWLRIRQLERAGGLPFDASSPDYLVLFVRGLTFSGSIERALLDDEDLCRERVWSLFEPENGVQRALVGGDRYWDPSNTWRVALVRLAQQGRIDPDQLRESAQRAARDERLGPRHRAWYGRIPKMLDDPDALPTPSPGGPPPPGNRLRR
jgi:hypothetical protein